MADPRLGAGGGLPGDAERRCACAALDAGARRRPRRQGQRRRRVRRAARSGGARAAGGPDAAWSFWDVDAPATLDRVHANPHDPFRRADPALRPGADLRRRRAGGATPTEASARASACRSTTRSTRPRTIPVAPDPRFAADLAFLGNRLPDREARVEEFFLRAAGRCCRTGASCSAATAGRTRRCRPNVRLRRPRLHRRPQRLQLHAARGAQRQPRQHGALRLLAGDARVRGRRRRRLPHHRRLGRASSSSSSPDARCWSRATAEEVAQHLRRARRRRARARSARPRAAACWPSTPTRTARRRSRRCCEAHADTVAAGGGRRMSSDALRIVILGLSITSSWGNGHATTYRGLVRELVAARPRRAVPRARRAVVRREPRPAATRRTGAPSSTAALDELRERFAPPGARRRPGDRRARTCPRGSAVGRLGAARRPAASTAFYDIDTPVTLARLERGDARVPRADADRRLRPLPLVHRRPDAGAARARVRLARARGRCTARSTRSCTARSRSRAALGPGLPGHLQRRPPAGARASCCWSRRAVGRRARFVVAGPQYPAAIEWPANVERPSTCRRPNTAPSTTRQRFTLNVTRADMVAAGWSPSVRLFEAAACGTPIISDRWAGLDSVLAPGREILLASSADEVLSVLTRSRRRGAAGAGRPGARADPRRAHRRAPGRAARKLCPRVAARRADPDPAQVPRRAGRSRPAATTLDLEASR